VRAVLESEIAVGSLGGHAPVARLPRLPLRSHSVRLGADRRALGALVQWPRDGLRCSWWPAWPAPMDGRPKMWQVKEARVGSVRQGKRFAERWCAA